MGGIQNVTQWFLCNVMKKIMKFKLATVILLSLAFPVLSSAFVLGFSIRHISPREGSFNQSNLSIQRVIFPHIYLTFVGHGGWFTLEGSAVKWAWKFAILSIWYFVIIFKYFLINWNIFYSFIATPQKTGYAQDVNYLLGRLFRTQYGKLVNL